MPNISFEIIVLNSLFSLFFFYSSLEIFFIFLTNLLFRKKC